MYARHVPGNSVTTLCPPWLVFKQEKRLCSYICQSQSLAAALPHLPTPVLLYDERFSSDKCPWLSSLRISQAFLFTSHSAHCWGGVCAFLAPLYPSSLRTRTVSSTTLCPLQCPTRESDEYHPKNCIATTKPQLSHDTEHHVDSFQVKAGLFQCGRLEIRNKDGWSFWNHPAQCSYRHHSATRIPLKWFHSLLTSHRDQEWGLWIQGRHGYQFYFPSLAG